MDQKLFELVKGQIPSMNKVVCDGLAVKEMKLVERYVDSLLRCAEIDFPPGLVYKEYRRITPVDEYIRATEPVGNKSQYEIARNDVYMILLVFEFKGEKITKPLYLPYVRDGGIMAIRGSSFSISPILADKGVSVGLGNAFVQLPKAKFTASRIVSGMKSNGVKRLPYISYSWIHNRRPVKGVPKFVNMETTLTHYLLAKYGIKETFRKFCNTDIVVGYEDEVNSTNYPEDSWVVCNSFKIKPRGVKSKYYTPTKIAVAVRSCDYDQVAESMLATFFYIVDHFPERIKPEYMDGTVDEIRMWRILLGLVIGGVTGGEGRIAEDMDEHMDSLDSYIDARARASLAQGDIFVNDVYELLFYLIEVLTHVVMQTTDMLATMWDKQLMILRYAIKDINDSIFNTGFKLKKAQLKRDLTASDVSKIIKRSILTDAILKMNNGSKHGEVASVSSPGDNKFFKVTSTLKLQADASGTGGRSKSGGGDKAKLLHASIAEVGSYTVLPKSEPNGRGRINPWILIDDNNCVVRKEENVKILDRVQNMISHSQ